MPRLLIALLLAAAGLVLPAAASEQPVLRLGLLKFGTVSWEIETIRRNGLDRAAGVEVQVVELAHAAAGKVALLGGSVDMVVSDWIWVSRQRDAGAAVTFLPYSRSVGAVTVPSAAPLHSLADLKGRRIGVAGGPLDKSWLIIKALARRQFGLDLDREAEVVFAAPPLLNRQVAAGELDAVLTYWHYAARLHAAGMRSLIDVEDAAAALGLDAEPAWIGYVVGETWARDNPQALAGFFAATQAAKRMLAGDDGAWEPLRPLMRAEDDATFTALRDGYRRGIPAAWGAAETAAAARLFAALAEIGGPELVGPRGRLAPGTFHPAAISP